MMSYFSTRGEVQLQSLPAGWLPRTWINSGSLRPVIEYSLHFSYTRSQHQTVHTHRASVHQAAKLVAALLRVARVNACVAESNGSLPPGLWLTSPAGWLPRTGISSVTLCSVIEYGLAPVARNTETLWDGRPSGGQSSVYQRWNLSG